MSLYFMGQPPTPRARTKPELGNLVPASRTQLWSHAHSAKHQPFVDQARARVPPRYAGEKAAGRLPVPRLEKRRDVAAPAARSAGLTSVFATDQLIKTAVRRDQQRELVFLEGIEPGVPRYRLEAFLRFVEIEPEDTGIFALSGAFDAGWLGIVVLCPAANFGVVGHGFG